MSVRSTGNNTVSSRGEGALACATPIDQLELSPRAHAILRQAGCHTVDDVLAIWPDRILQLNGVGHMLVREVYESLRKVVPNRSSVLFPNVFRGRVSVQVPYSTDKNVFLTNAVAQWEACVQKDRERERASRRQLERISEKGSLEADIAFLRLCRSGVAPWQMAQEKKCSRAAANARKRRLILRYAHPSRLQGLPKDLQDFVVQAAQQYPAGIKE